MEVEGEHALQKNFCIDWLQQPSGSARCFVFEGIRARSVSYPTDGWIENARCSPCILSIHARLSDHLHGFFEKALVGSLHLRTGSCNQHALVLLSSKEAIQQSHAPSWWCRQIASAPIQFAFETAVVLCYAAPHPSGSSRSQEEPSHVPPSFRRNWRPF